MRPALGLAPFLLASALAGASIAQPAPNGPQAGAPDGPAPPFAPGAGWRDRAPSPQMLEARRAVRAQCEADMARLCPEAAAAPVPQEGAPTSARGGGYGGRRGGAMRCLRERQSEVSPSCRSAMEAMRAARGPRPPGSDAPGGPTPDSSAPEGAGPPVAPQG